MAETQSVFLKSASERGHHYQCSAESQAASSEFSLVTAAVAEILVQGRQRQGDQQFDLSLEQFDFSLDYGLNVK